MQHKFVITVIVVCLILSGLIYYLHEQNPAYDIASLTIGNVTLAMVSLLSFNIIKRGIRADNPNSFVRAKMTGTMLKFFICIAILLIYIFVKDRVVHKPSLFLFLGMYVVYSAIEAVPLSQLAKKK
ncbi:hypothetical protein [Taibaiella koreensis]|uniref:hypothetical protein n=1 Tax=Taibaiella koreensis TaxID=1268548 RepID=UPI000E59EFBB|nr:hypothetical protein [Taibaiella koreensis]